VSISPERLSDLKIGESATAFDDFANLLEFPINPEKTAQLLRRLVPNAKLRARVYDRQGVLLVDSAYLHSTGAILKSNLPPPAHKESFLEKHYHKFMRWVRSGDLPLYYEHHNQNLKAYSEGVQALNGRTAPNVKMSETGDIVVLVAVPIARFRTVFGALLLSTQDGEIDGILSQERLNIFLVTLVTALIMFVLSVILARDIAGPMRTLALSADRVGKRVKAREVIPDFTDRHDEIGRLSGSLREMTASLYNRIEATERFAADVAHELKNPLTSMRSAVETLPLAKTPESQARLLDVIQHDVKRLDRLITDISQASRLDADLARREMHDVELIPLLETLIDIAKGIEGENGVNVSLTYHGLASNYIVKGQDSRLAQVFTNLIDNARSFTPKGKNVRLTLSRLKDSVKINVEDEGPGIREDALSKVFERFYTDRPNSSFGQNSGLGLSIVKQIIEAHSGKITAANAQNGGACFTIILPLEG
jgi:two-component system, OmpR family, sensor histidine kinase ChvG